MALRGGKFHLWDLTNIRDPEAARLERPRRRGGSQWFNAEITNRRGLSVAYEMCSEEEQQELKHGIVEKYKKQIDWKRLGVIYDDKDAVMRIFGDVL